MIPCLEPYGSFKHVAVYLLIYRLTQVSIVAWVYDGIISSGVNRWVRDVHCIVGVLGVQPYVMIRS